MTNYFDEILSNLVLLVLWNPTKFKIHKDDLTIVLEKKGTLVVSKYYILIYLVSKQLRTGF